MKTTPRSRAGKAARLAAIVAAAMPAAGCGSASERAAAAAPERIVSLAPSLTEILCAIGAGDRLVGRSSACDFPPEIVARVPVAGDFGRPSLERLLALRPTLVLSVDLEDNTLPESLQRIGVRLEIVPCRTLDDVPRAIRRVGALAGRPEAAEALAAAMERGIAERRAEVADGAAPTVYVELWHDPILTVGATSYISEVIRLAGGRNLGDVVMREYFEPSPEWVLQADPDIVLCPGMGEAHDVIRRMAERPGWSGLRALRAGRVIAEVPADLLLRPGPRLLEAVDALSAALRRAGRGNDSP